MTMPEPIPPPAPVPSGKIPRVATASAVLSDGSLVEMLFDPVESRTRFCIMKDGNVRMADSVSDRGQRLVPYSPQNNLLSHEVVLFPSKPGDYGSDHELLAEIQAFIHEYVDVSPLFEKVASYYILFTWVHDCFNELPYLRVRGDTGSGKTRCLLTVGSLCYKPIFASGASTVSPLFRILDSFRGTLIVDEGDFRFSDEKADIVKILNNGNARGFPVLRSESVSGKEFDPRAYSVFGPKMIATRSHFEDRALETRCITEETSGRKMREDIPLNLGDEWKVRGRELRNKLLTFRFRNYGKREIDQNAADRTIEPRIAQLFLPLMSVIADEPAREELRQLAKAYNNELIVDRSTDIEASVLEIIREVLAKTSDGRAPIKEITRLFGVRHADEYDRRVTPKWIGGIVRKNLQLKTEKSNGVFVLVAGQRPKLERLWQLFGIETLE